MKTLSICALFVVMAFAVRAQESKPYWVIETNQNSKNFTIVRAYDAQHKLLFEETLQGKYLTVTSRKDRKFIDRLVRDRIKLDTLASIKKQARK